MAINLDPAEGAPAPSAGRLDRHDAEARQDRWMLELERAMFSTSAKKLRGAIQPRCAVPRQDEGALAQQEVVRPNGADAAPATAAAAAGRRFAGAASLSSARGRGADGPQPGTGSSERAPGVQAAHDASAERDMTGTRAGDQGAMAAVVHVHRHALADARTSAAGFVAAGGRAAVAPAAHIASGAATSVDVVANSGHVGSMQAVQAAQQAMTPAVPAALGQAAEPPVDGSAPAGLGPDMAEQADAGAATLVDVAEFDKRLMHLFSSPDGMHAYIRDAELGAAQIRSVAVALGMELAASGQSLSTLTVNGKRISLAIQDAPSPAFDADEAASGAGDVLAGPRPYPESLTLVRKGSSE